jgi:hypothetical protein
MNELVDTTITEETEWARQRQHRRGKALRAPS